MYFPEMHCIGDFIKYKKELYRQLRKWNTCMLSFYMPPLSNRQHFNMSQICCTENNHAHTALVIAHTRCNFTTIRNKQLSEKGSLFYSTVWNSTINDIAIAASLSSLKFRAKVYLFRCLQRLSFFTVIIACVVNCLFICISSQKIACTKFVSPFIFYLLILICLFVFVLCYIRFVSLHY